MPSRTNNINTNNSCKNLPNCDRITNVKEPLRSKDFDIRSSCRMYNSEKCTSQKIIKAWRIFLLIEWLNRNTKKKHTEIRENMRTLCKLPQRAKILNKITFIIKLVLWIMNNIKFPSKMSILEDRNTNAKSMRDLMKTIYKWIIPYWFILSVIL